MPLVYCYDNRRLFAVSSDILTSNLLSMPWGVESYDIPPEKGGISGEGVGVCPRLEQKNILSRASHAGILRRYAVIICKRMTWTALAHGTRLITSNRENFELIRGYLKFGAEVRRARCEAGRLQALARSFGRGHNDRCGGSIPILSRASESRTWEARGLTNILGLFWLANVLSSIDILTV